MLTSAEITTAFDVLEFNGDDRRPPDEQRRSRFRTGWRDAERREDGYSQATLAKLTWQNLGYRLGERFGQCPDSDIDFAFYTLADHYVAATAPTAPSSAQYTAALEEQGWDDTTNVLLPEESEATTALYEGAVCRVAVNVYERNPKARRLCLAEYGYDCVVCGFNFVARYGDVGREFIHVHHLTPVSNIGTEYKVDPIRDLRPVCPNCHGIIHRRIPAYTIDEVRAFLQCQDGDENG